MSLAVSAYQPNKFIITSLSGKRLDLTSSLLRFDYYEDVLAISNYAIDFPVLIARKNIFGAQFHPEKSSKIGLHFLENFNNF